MCSGGAGRVGKPGREPRGAVPSRACRQLAMLAAVGVLLAGPSPTRVDVHTAPAAQPAQGAAETSGLRWRFVRIKYQYQVDSQYSFADFGEPWYIDAPAAEQNLTRRIRTVTAIDTADPIVMTLQDPALWRNPWVYIVEPSNLRLTDAEVPILREFLLRGGTAMFDDFHGPVEWDLFAAQMKRVFPDRAIVDLEPDHPLFRCFYRLDAYPQVAGLGSFLAGRTWEKGGMVAKLRTILDDAGRPMLLINWNTDLGDGWEWSNAEDYPGYIRHTADAYRITINQIVYALTH